MIESSECFTSNNQKLHTIIKSLIKFTQNNQKFRMFDSQKAQNLLYIMIESSGCSKINKKIKSSIKFTHNNQKFRIF